MTQFKSVSEWQAAGGVKTGWSLLLTGSNQTHLAIGFNAVRNNQATVCWIAKDKLLVVANDVGGAPTKRAFLIPTWLLNLKQANGYVFGAKPVKTAESVIAAINPNE